MIKFNKFNVANTVTREKARVNYSVGNRVDGRACVTLYAKDYDHKLAFIFEEEYVNETDMLTDYFERGKVTLFADHPLYNAALTRATT